MIIPGKSVGKIKIGDNIDMFPGAVKESVLSLNQTLFKYNNDIKIRTNADDDINWISTKNIDLKSSYEFINIGNSFKEIINEYDLLYDDFEGLFKIENTKGMCFSFGTENLSEVIKSNLKIQLILVYSVKMDNDEHLWFDTKVNKNNLKDFI